MRILALNQDPGIRPGAAKGAVVHVAAMRAAFAELGAEVVALDEPDPTRAAAVLAAECARGLDLVYERYALGRTAAAAVCRAHRVPLVLEVNAPLAEEELRWRGGARAAEASDERALFAAAALVLAVSTDTARYAVERGAAPERVQVRANGVDPRRFRPRAADDALRARLVPAGRFALGFHGRLRPWHGLELLARAAAELLERGVDLQLVLVGAGEFDAALAHRVPAERVTRVPWVEHDAVGAYVACFDALALTYAPDAPCWFSPLKLAEAMACGVVPVLPALGDLAAAVTHGGDALVYPAGDQAALVGAVERLARDPELRARLARAAVASAGRRSWRAIAELVLASVATAARA